MGNLYTTILMEQRLDTEVEGFSFTKDDVGGDLTDLGIGITLQISNGSTQESVSTRLDFTLGEENIE